MKNCVIIRKSKNVLVNLLKQLQIACVGNTHTLEAANTHTLLCAYCITGAMIYRRATMCVEVFTERNERLLTTPLRSNAVDFVEARRAFFPRARRRFVHQSIDWFV